jgi:hypothetical protein
MVLAHLQEASLHLDISKHKFEVKKTKYLGFILEARKGIQMDHAKVKAIVEWKAPCLVKGI